MGRQLFIVSDIFKQQLKINSSSKMGVLTSMALSHAKLKTRKIMFSGKDFERLWYLYKTESEPKGVSINSFRISNNIPYTAFYNWFKKISLKDKNLISEESLFKQYLNAILGSEVQIKIMFTNDIPVLNSGKDY